MADLSTVVAAGDRPEHRSGVARFGVFELDLRTGELRRDGVKVRLQEQPFRLLEILIENAGEVVTRDELRARLWPAEFVDFDHSLNAAVRKLRSALDDNADNPRFVETLARRGYRFIAPVTWITSTPAPPPSQSQMRVTVIAGAIALAILIVIAGAAVFFRQRTARASIDSLAVLPFTADEQQSAHLTDGLTEVMIDALSRQRDLRVMARTTSFRYRTESDPLKVARELNVGGVVTGSLARDRDQYALRIELIDASDGAQIWAGRYAGAVSDLPRLQQRASEELTSRLRSMRGHDQQPAATAATRSAEAYDLYLKGLFAWNRRGRDDLQRAIDLFTRATQVDPTFASAYAGLANTYGVMVGYGLLSPQEGAPKVLAAARRALQLDPNSAEALTSIATTEYRNLWDFPAAERDFRRAIALNPSYATAHQWYSEYLRSMGRPDEARRETDAAYRLDPFSLASNANKCYSFYQDRRFDDAIAFARRMRTVDPSFGHPQCLVAALLAKGDFEGAIAEIGRLPGQSAERLEALYRKGGPHALFRARLEELLAQPNPETRSPVEIAVMYTQLGEFDAAFAWLEKAYDRRVTRLTNINCEPLFDPIRNDPRFADLLRRIHLPG